MSRIASRSMTAHAGITGRGSSWLPSLPGGRPVGVLGGARVAHREARRPTAARPRPPRRPLTGPPPPAPSRPARAPARPAGRVQRCPARWRAARGHEAGEHVARTRGGQPRRRLGLAADPAVRVTTSVVAPLSSTVAPSRSAASRAYRSGRASTSVAGTVSPSATEQPSQFTGVRGEQDVLPERAVRGRAARRTAPAHRRRPRRAARSPGPPSPPPAGPRNARRRRPRRGPPRSSPGPRSARPGPARPGHHLGPALVHQRVAVDSRTDGRRPDVAHHPHARAQRRRRRPAPPPPGRRPTRRRRRARRGGTCRPRARARASGSRRRTG